MGATQSAKNLQSKSTYVYLKNSEYNVLELQSMWDKVDKEDVINKFGKYILMYEDVAWALKNKEPMIVIEPQDYESVEIINPHDEYIKNFYPYQGEAVMGNSRMQFIKVDNYNRDNGFVKWLVGITDDASESEWNSEWMEDESGYVLEIPKGGWTFKTSKEKVKDIMSKIHNTVDEDGDIIYSYYDTPSRFYLTEEDLNSEEPFHYIPTNYPSEEPILWSETNPPSMHEPRFSVDDGLVWIRGAEVIKVDDSFWKFWEEKVNAAT